MKEFRKIKSLKFMYEINEDGIVRNIKSKKIIKPYIDNNGYYRFTFHNKGIGVIHKHLHQLMMECYGGPKPGEGYVIDHIDRNRQNNNIHNLRWVTYSGNSLNRDNSRISITSKRTIKYANESRKQPIYCIDKNNNKFEFNSITEGAIFICNNSDRKQGNVVRGIATILNKKRNYIYGYLWYRK